MALAVVRSGTGDTDVVATAPASLESSMTDEIFAQATPEQALSFFLAVGGRIAAGRLLPLDGGVAALEQAMNDVWRELALGQVTLTMEADGIDIDHRGYAAGPVRSGAWPQAAAALLRGAYATWFQAIGGPGLETRFVRQTSERIILHHGL